MELLDTPDLDTRGLASGLPRRLLVGGVLAELLVHLGAVFLSMDFFFGGGRKNKR